MKHFKQILFCCLVCTHLQFSCGKDAGVSSNQATASVGVGTGGSMARFTIIGNYLYTVDSKNLKVFSIADPVNPILKNTVAIGFEIETIYPFKDKLFIGSTSAVYIYSISNPEQPARLGTAISPNVIRRCDPVIARDTVAYATLRTNSACGGGPQSILAVYDVKNIQNPIQKTFLNITEPYGLGFADSTLYVATKNGLNIYNINTEYNPFFIRNDRSQDWFYDVIPFGNVLICWVKDGVLFFDITNRRNPVFISKIV